MDDTFTCWLRLSQAYIIMGHHDAACNVLITASELHPDKWEIWRDLSILSEHCKNFDKMISSYHRVMYLKKSYTNTNLLIKLARQVEFKTSHCGSLGQDVRMNAINLFSSLIIENSENPVICALYGLVVISTDNISEDEITTTVYYLKKSVLHCTEDPYWFKKYFSVHHVVSVSLIVAEIFLSCGKILKNKMETKDLLKIIITHLKEIIYKVEEHHTDIIRNVLKSEFRPSIKKLEESLMCLENMEVNTK